MKNKPSFEVVFGKYIKPVLVVLAIIAVVAAIIGICALYEYLALNVWIPKP